MDSGPEDGACLGIESLCRGDVASESGTDGNWRGKLSSPSEARFRITGILQGYISGGIKFTLLQNLLLDVKVHQLIPKMSYFTLTNESSHHR